ncbi:melanotransferrin [Octopus bimaculoides]|uniref:Transferrin-like domain-containing protein n=1 Tax=Octopus bimaculoides TaxID=37653 RepID=A0A0L8GB16_OCTBM|nr:melanotransferrin [Octopus bimaculoides]|eukprot:XP_014782585.1 PREDICTED: melanotransferrin-like [Octopus bimaculoides]
MASVFSLTVLWFILTSILVSQAEDEIVVRWCVVNPTEEIKCKDLQKKLENIVQYPRAAKYKLKCLLMFDIFECMENIQTNKADIITLDPGHGFYAGKYHYMHPIMAEKYSNSDPLKFYSVLVVNADSQITINSMEGKRICFPSIGNAAGWVYPVSEMIKKQMLEIKDCNSIGNSVAAFFGGMCLPGGFEANYNPFGNNPNSICDSCSGSGNERCTMRDPYSGYDGAFKCLEAGRGDMAFLRDNTVKEMVANSILTENEFRLVCPNGGIKEVSEYESCNWGIVPSHIVMASRAKADVELTAFKNFLTIIDGYFGANSNSFELYNSNQYNKYAERNLLFTDGTVGLEELQLDNSYYSWVGTDYIKSLNLLNTCPLHVARWCVTSLPEKMKCEDLMMSLKAKNIFPELDCILAESAIGCMELIEEGVADLVTLDAGDVYTAGRRYNLIPIAAEDYGDMTMSFHVVAIAKKTESFMTLFNMKKKRACQAGVGRGDGWVIPLGVYIDTEQFIPEECNAFRNIGELFIRACIPGALDKEYNSEGTSISLCEGCGAEGFRKCQRNSEEQYYGANGAFRCLVESGGDVAFVRHLTPRDNTDGRNHAKWARNRRSDDYELLCKGGGRANIDDWEKCHLGKVPANAIVTGSYKDNSTIENYWNLLNYGQQFFSSDTDGDFHMFDSGTYYNDLLFTDSAVRLMQLPEEKQNYKTYLGPNFISQIEALKQYTCMPIDGSPIQRLSPSLLLAALSFLFFFSSLL